ncbi:hypothetical protein EDD16DRAFT_1552061 [Pisolithus croceorrhizus]|nr:hypothetical protein EDD16DRAFT_1552061 [Pisolithus croceorrhizus]
MDYKPGSPPPGHNVLRPHHVDLFAMILLAFKEFHGKLPQQFLLYIYRFLIVEVSEAVQPATHQQIVDFLKGAPLMNNLNIQNYILAFESAPKQLINVAQLTSFFHSATPLYTDKSGDEPSILFRRSPFGFFCRRCHTGFSRLSFYGVMELLKDYQSWCAGDTKAGYGPVEKDLLTGDIWLFTTMSDYGSTAHPQAFEAWEKGRDTGDDVIGPENLRRYFEQMFHTNNDSGIRQNALLNLIRMHYVRKEYAAASKLLQEAIAVARTCGDRVTLQHCISMLHRLPTPSGVPVLNEIQPDLHPLEVLYDVAKLLQPRSGQPLTLAFEKVAQATGLYNSWVDLRKISPHDRERLGLHAMQAVLWSTLGTLHRLAKVEESIVQVFSRWGDDDPNRLNSLLNQAHRMARNGLYQDALALLVQPRTWRGLSLDLYQEWASMIWHILALRISRRGQRRLFHDFLLPRQPSSSTFVSKEYFFDDCTSSLPPMSDELHQVMSARRRGQAVTAMQPLLQSLWNSGFQGRFPLYRLGIILLADVGLEFGMSKHCQSLMEGILPQLLPGHEIEHRALACYTLGRCIIASFDTELAELRRALPHLLMAEDDYVRLEMFEAASDVQWLLMVVYHNLGMTAEGTVVYERYNCTTAKIKMYEESSMDEEAESVWTLVTDVGALLAGR